MVVATVAMSWSGSSAGQVDVQQQQSLKQPNLNFHRHEIPVPTVSSIANNEDHHRCRRATGRLTLLSSQSCPSFCDCQQTMLPIDQASMTIVAPRNSFMASSLPINFESLLAASLQANVVTAETLDGHPADFVDMDEATAALSSLIVGHSFVSSSPTKIDCEDTNSKSTTIAITHDDLDLLSEWDLLSPPSDEPTSPSDEGVVLNSSVPCSEHSQLLTSSCSSSSSSSCSSTVSAISSPLSVSTASSTSHYMSSYNTDQYGSAAKKRVRFADAHGKPLAVVCTFANSPIGSYDSANNTPVATTLSRIFNLVQAPLTNNGYHNGYHQISNCNNGGYHCGVAIDSDCMELLFPDPLTSYSTLTEKLRSQNVTLESVCCRGGFVKGMVRVRNLSYSKHVFVRTTFDAWTTSHDWQADFFPIIAPSDGRSEYDLFEFSIPIPPHLMPGTIVDFCICYRCGDQPGEFWDNNGGRNYSLRYRPLNNFIAAQRRLNENNLKVGCCPTSTASRTAAELEAERAQRIREFVWSEFASWNGGSALVANRTAPPVVSGVRVASVVTTVSTTTTSPAGKEVPYW